MALKAVVDALTDVPEAVRGEYELKDGKYHLTIEGDVPGYAKAAALAEANGKVVEFRDRNIVILKRAAEIAGVDSVEDLEPLAAILERFKGVDPDEYKTLKAKAEELAKKGVNKPDDVAAQITAALDAFKTSTVKPLQDQLATSSAELKAERKRGDEAALRHVVGEKFLKAGGRGKAMDFIVTRSAEVFHVENGEVKAQPNKFSTENPGEPLGIDEWLAAQTAESDFAFDASKGAGARPKEGGSSRTGMKKLVNPTPQELGQPWVGEALRKGELEIVSE